MTTEFVIKGGATKDKLEAIKEYNKTKDITVFDKIAKVITTASKIILV